MSTSSSISSVMSYSIFGMEWWKWVLILIFAGALLYIGKIIGESVTDKVR